MGTGRRVILQVLLRSAVLSAGFKFQEIQRALAFVVSRAWIPSTAFFLFAPRLVMYVVLLWYLCR